MKQLCLMSETGFEGMVVFYLYLLVCFTLVSLRHLALYLVILHGLARTSLSTCLVYTRSFQIQHFQLGCIDDIRQSPYEKNDACNVCPPLQVAGYE